MTFDEGVVFINNLIEKHGQGQFNPYGDIIINYPGKKRKNDYRLTVTSGIAPTHPNISEELYDLIESGDFSFDELASFLEDTFKYGTNMNYNNNILNDLMHKIYWITLQEEINYPKSRGFASIHLPFCRYYEAIYSTRDDSTFNLNEVKKRCNNHYGPRPALYSDIIAPYYYHY